MRSKRVERLLALIQSLQAGRALTVEDLGEQLGVSRRTVFRDLELLAEAGIPYEYDRASKRYSTDRIALLPPVHLTHAEAFALIIATRHLMQHQSIIDQPAAASAAIKMESILPPAIQDYCGTALEHVEIRHDPASDPKAAAAIMPALQIALAKRLKIRVHYNSYLDEEVIDVVLSPYRLAYLHRGWYLIAYCQRFREVRTFKVERVRRVAILDEHFRIDDDFNLDDYFGNAWLMIRGEKRCHIKVRFLPKVARNVNEIRWHKTQQTKFTEDGSLIFEADVDGVSEIAWWIMGYADEAEVLEPAELRDEIARRAQRMVALYQQDKPVGRSRGSRQCAPLSNE